MTVDRPATELDIWRESHAAGENFLAAIEDDMPALAGAVRAYRVSIEELLVRAGFEIPRMAR